MHRASPVCRAEKGNTSHFRCPYHGDLQERRGVERRGAPCRDLSPARRLALRFAPGATCRHQGLVFASLDPARVAVRVSGRHVLVPGRAVRPQRAGEGGRRTPAATRSPPSGPKASRCRCSVPGDARPTWSSTVPDCPAPGCLRRLAHRCQAAAGNQVEPPEIEMARPAAAAAIPSSSVPVRPAAAQRGRPRRGGGVPPCIRSVAAALSENRAE